MRMYPQIEATTATTKTKNQIQNMKLQLETETTELKPNIAERASMLAEICMRLTEVIKAAPNGIPTGTLYALLISHGCTKSQFDSIVDVLLRVGVVHRNGYVLIANRNN